jgi:hypothetical protein
MIGILYPSSTLSRLIKRKHSFEKPAFYVETARKIGEEIIFFSLFDIDWKKGTVRSWDGVEPVLLSKALPSVIINRTRTNRTIHKKWIQRLKQMGKIIFNEHNIISKLHIHRILLKNNRLLPHLPTTDSVNLHSVKELLEQNSCLFLKPKSSSVGNGIIRFRKKKHVTIAEFNLLGRTKRQKVGIEQIIKIVRRKKQNYLVQQGISLMKYQGRSVDFRVSVQKDGKGRWHYTGMVGKVAKKGAIVTNLHCGGQSLKVSELFQSWGWNAASIEKKVAKLGIRIAKTLDKELPHIADLGLDIALDEQQHPWFIEANFRDLRITFRDAGENEKWQATYATPIYYAAYLIRQIKEQEKQVLEKHDDLMISSTNLVDELITSNNEIIHE